MRLGLWIILLAALGGAALARSDPPILSVEAVPEVEASEPARRPLLMPAVFYLVPRPEADYVEEHSRLLSALVRATDAGGGAEAPDAARAVLDLAEFRFAHAMAVEGLALLEGLDPAQLPPDHASRLAALQLALGLIDPRDRPLTEAAEQLLSPRYAGWADQPFFLALAAIRDGKPADAAPLLPAALNRLARFPAPVRAAVLPGLLDTAIETAQWRVARDLAALFDLHAELRDSPAYHYLLGRAAETGGDLLAALDSYTRAGAGGDLWAHRARVALVAMGLRSGTLEAGEARVLLEQVRQLWWGDSWSRAVLRDLSVLQAAEGDRLAALETLGALLSRYPDSEEAKVGRGKARELIAAVYAEGASGKLPLAGFLAAHRRIAPDFRFDPEFAPAAESFADRFRDLGATGIAAEEYGAIHDYLAVSRDLGLQAVTPERLDELRLKQVETLLQGGRLEDAGAVLRAGLQSQDPVLQDRFNTLAAQLYSETGERDAVLETEVFVPTENYLRIKAAAYFDLADWAGAEQAYGQLFALYGPDLDFADAVNMVLATFRNGHGEQAVALARTFQDLAERPEWAAIAASLTDEAPDLLPLRRDTAQKRIDSAADTLERLDPAAQSN